MKVICIDGGEKESCKHKGETKFIIQNNIYNVVKEYNLSNLYGCNGLYYELLEIKRTESDLPVFDANFFIPLSEIDEAQFERNIQSETA